MLTVTVLLMPYFLCCNRLSYSPVFLSIIISPNANRIVTGKSSEIVNRKRD